MIFCAVTIRTEALQPLRHPRALQFPWSQLMQLGPPRNIVRVVARRAVVYDPAKPIPRKSVEDWERLAKPLRRELRIRQVLYWLAVGTFVSSVVLGFYRLIR